ncbi:hypothetical protein D3C78_315300 [compost metagenome]
MELKNYFAQDASGNALPGATCYLYQPGTETLATGLQDDSGAALANPFAADAKGLIQFAAENGQYDLRVMSGGRDYRVRVQCNDVADSITAAAAEADRAEVAAVAADADAVRAETAAEAAIATGKVYQDTAAGLAATTSGQYFSVPSAESTEYMILYRNNAGAAQDTGKRYPSSNIDALSVNATKAYPLKSAVRDGITSVAASQANNAILDIQVVGARAGKIYRLEFIANGVVLSDVVRYDMLFNEYDKATYATLSATGKSVAVALGDIPATSIEAGDVITRTFVSTRIPGLSFVVTYRPGAITGTSLDMLNNNTYAAWSWYIDESRYVYADSLDAAASAAIAGAVAGVNANLQRKTLAYSIASGSISIAWRLSSTHDIRIKIEPVGINGLYNINNIAVAAHGGTPPTLNRTWTGISSNGTDWIGPYIVGAVNNGDGAAQAFTGGTHGSNGDTTGSPTALSLAWSVSVDGVVVTTDLAGGADQITVSWTNQLQAYNTKSTQRSVLNENVTLRVTAGCAEVQVETVPIEDIRIYRYYGMQCQAGGFDSSVHFVKGQQGARFNYVAGQGYNSGRYDTHPDVPVIAMRGTYGELWMMLDESYGAALSRVIDAFQPLAQFVSTRKGYTTLVYSTPGKLLTAGTSQRWRGWYAWTENLTPGGLCDSAVRYKDGREVVYRAIMTAAGNSELRIKPADRNLKTSFVSGSGDSYTGPNRTGITAPAYGIVELRVQP